MPTQQLPLAVSLRDDATFDNYFAEPEEPNANLVKALKNLIGGDSGLLFCWGETGCGITHLLQASCQSALNKDLSAQYIPLSEVIDFPPEELLQGLENTHLLCLDEIQAAIGYVEWEQAIFNLVNRVREQKGRLIFGANQNPLYFYGLRDDLRSRFAWGGIFNVKLLTDNQKKSALTLRAKARGMALNEDVASYILNRAPRDMKQLFLLLDRLDQKSLESKRKLTIPFVKEVIG